MVFLNSSLYFVGLFLLGMCVFPFCFFLSLILTHLSTFLVYIQMEACSIEDKGESICFNVYCYNVQPGIKINYATGDSTGPGNETTKPSVSASEPTVSNNNTGADGETVWIPSSGTKYHSNSGCSNMTNPTQVTKDEAIKRGYEPCKKCY